jgi:hypothetical protein
MQKVDLEEKWREIQQTKLSKENQRLLGETAPTSRSQEFAGLDRVNKQKEAFHNRSYTAVSPLISMHKSNVKKW